MSWPYLLRIARDQFFRPSDPAGPSLAIRFDGRKHLPNNFFRFQTRQYQQHPGKITFWSYFVCRQQLFYQLIFIGNQARSNFLILKIIFLESASSSAFTSSFFWESAEIFWSRRKHSPLPKPVHFSSVQSFFSVAHFFYPCRSIWSLDLLLSILWSTLAGPFDLLIGQSI